MPKHRWRPNRIIPARSRVEVRERPGKPGNYQAVVHLRPHFQLDELSSSIRLVTELSAAAPQ